MNGIPKTPQEEENYNRRRISIPKFQNSYGCIQDVVSFTANPKSLGPSRMLVGNVSGPCRSGFYYLTSLPETNLFLLVVENWIDNKDAFYPFNCHITQQVVASGAYRIINGTCAHNDSLAITLEEDEKCIKLANVILNCTYNQAPVKKSQAYILNILMYFTWTIIGERIFT